MKRWMFFIKLSLSLRLHPSGGSHFGSGFCVVICEIKTTARPCHAVTKWKWRLLDIPTFKVTKTVHLKEGAKLYKMSKDLRAVTMGLSTVAVLLCRNRVVGKSWVRHRCRPPDICERGRRHISLAVSTYAQRNGGKAAPLTSSFHVAHTET